MPRSAPRRAWRPASRPTSAGHAGTAAAPGANPCSGNQDARHIYSKMNPPSYVVGVNTSVPIFATPVADFAGWYRDALPGPTQDCVTSTSPEQPARLRHDHGREPSGLHSRQQQPDPGSDAESRLHLPCRPDDEPRRRALLEQHHQDADRPRDDLHRRKREDLERRAEPYNGQATIYLSGTLLLNGQLCGGRLRGELRLRLLEPEHGDAGDRRERDRPPGPSRRATRSTSRTTRSFQGALYATGNLDYGNNAYSDGPMVGPRSSCSNNVVDAVVRDGHDRAGRDARQPRGLRAAEPAAALQRLRSLVQPRLRPPIGRRVDLALAALFASPPGSRSAAS